MFFVFLTWVGLSGYIGSGSRLERALSAILGVVSAACAVALFL